MSALRVLLWLALVGIAVSTLGPLEWRPETGLPPQVERFAAYLTIGLLWVMAYPRHRWIGVLALIALAGLLELGQEIVPGRHGRLRDAEAKAVGVVVGAALGSVLIGIGRRPINRGG